MMSGRSLRAVEVATFLLAASVFLPLTTLNAFTLPSANRESNLRSRVLSPTPVPPRHAATFQNVGVDQQQQARVSSSSTSLQAFPLVASFQSLSTLAFVVCFHEAGHYLAARSLGMKVEEFSVGVGPRLLNFTKFGNEFSLRAFPLGGYVRFPQNYNTSLVVEQEQAVVNASKDAMGNPPEVAQFLNFVSLGNYQKECDEKVERAVKELEKERRATPFWKRLFEKQAATPKASTQVRQSLDDIEIEYYDDPNLLQNRPWPQRAVVIAGGVVFNLILAFLIYFAKISGEGLAQPVYQNGAVVSQSPAITSPCYGLLKERDVILGVAGHPLSDIRKVQFDAVTAASDVDKFIQTIRATEPGDELSLEVQRGEEKLDVKVSPRGKETGSFQSLGILLQPNKKGDIFLKSSSVLETARLSLYSVGEIASQAIAGYNLVLQKFISGTGGGAKLSGPVGLIKAGSDVAKDSGGGALLLFAAAISVNLAVVNSLPLPALDGGQMVFILCEAITRRKVDQRAQEQLTGLAFLFLFLLVGYTTFGDLFGSKL